ncbi:major facilitator superfamily domain-containing protein [Zopfochytrium polystomum]|nr:major facilitator superfamily domain-containing protein [Zopfochytrium polystomum]
MERTSSFPATASCRSSVSVPDPSSSHSSSGDAGSFISSPYTAVCEEGHHPHLPTPPSSAKPHDSEKMTIQIEESSNEVSWDGPSDPENPKNFSNGRKWTVTFMISLFTFLAPLGSSIVSPALFSIAQEFQISSDIELKMVMSIFVLAFAIGPLLLAPLSEIYGRVVVIQLSSIAFFIFSLACGFAQSTEQLLIFRFLSGLGGSAPLAIGSGALSDMFPPEERGRAVSVYALAPLLGPAVGPIIGAFIAQSAGWRWTFFFTAIFSLVVQVAGTFFVQETYHPVLLSRKAARLRRETGNPLFHGPGERLDQHGLERVWHETSTAAIRPFKLLGTQPIIQLLSLYMAFLYGLLYLVLATFPTLWRVTYHEPTGLGGLNYLSLGLGLFVSTQFTARLSDRIYWLLRATGGRLADLVRGGFRVANGEPELGAGKPEYRIPLIVPGATLMPVGLFLYGWSAQEAMHWSVPNLGIFIFATGVNMGFQCINMYVVDAYQRYAASATASVVFMRSLAGFGFPLFAESLYNATGYGWGNTLLGVMGIIIGIPAPFLLWKFGEAIRKRSTYASG